MVEEGKFREDLFYRLNVFTIALPPLRERSEDIVPIAERFLRLAAKRYGGVARSLSESAAQRLRAHAWPGNIRELRNAMDQAAVLARGEVVGPDELELVRTRLGSPRARRVEYAPTSLAPREPASVRSNWDPGRDARPELRDRNMDADAEAPKHAAMDAARSVEPDAESATNLRQAVDDFASEHPLVVRVAIGTPLAEVERLLILQTLRAASGNKQRAARILGISRRGLYVRLAAYGEHVSAAEASEADSS
jgi:DNA-binding NtrC family response regulator